MTDSNLLVTVVIGLAAYGAFELLRHIAKFIRERRRARTQPASDEEAYRAYARERESIRTKFDPEKTWNEATPRPAAYLSEMHALNLRFGGMLRRRNGEGDPEDIGRDA